MRDDLKARNIQIMMDVRGYTVAVDADEIAMVRSVARIDASVPGARIVGRVWELTLKSGATVCVDYEVPLQDMLKGLGVI